MQKLCTLLQPLLLTARDLQPLGYGDGISCPHQQDRHQWQAEAACPAQPLGALSIVLELSIQQGERLPLLQQIQRLTPGFPLQQTIQFHPQTRREGGRCPRRRVVLAPGPGPLLNGAANLLSALLCQLELQPRGVSGGTEHPGGIVLNAAPMQKTQLA